MATSTPVLEVRDLTVGYEGRTVVRDVSFSVADGEVFAIMGPSGCGKTTLLKSVLGLLPPLSGEVLYRGAPLRDSSALSRFRRSTGMVFQQGALLNSETLQTNVALPLREHTALPPEMVREVVRMKLAQVGLLEAADRKPGELSGGMRKRAGIARALAVEPDLLFFDEPSGGLDPVTADGIDNLLLSLREALGVAMVVVSHELASVFKVADRILMLRRGTVAALGTREEIRASRDDEVRMFIDRRAAEEPGAADEFLAETEGGRE